MRLTATTRRPNLNRGLVAFWNMAEASGTRADSVGGHDLSATGSVASGAAHLGVAAASVTGGAANNNFLFSADGALAFTGPGQGMTLAMWLNPVALNLTKPVVHKMDTNSTIEYKLALQSNASLAWQVTTDGATLVSTANPANTMAAAGEWYLALAWYDPIAGKIGLQCGRASTGQLFPPTLTAFTAGIFSGSAKFRVGNDPPNNRTWNGLLGPGGVWSRALTGVERNQLFAAGVGRAYPFF